MSDEAVAAAGREQDRDEAPTKWTSTRMRAALRTSANWFELVRFGTVGASGYVVNLIVFAVLVHGVQIDYKLAAAGAFVVALANNFFWNRHWTFKAGEGHAGFQAARFVVVSLVAFGFNLAVLYMLVEWFDVAKVPAQAVAIASATPLNFLGNKLWSFRT